MFVDRLAEMWGRSTEEEKRHLKVLAVCVAGIGVAIADKLAYGVLQHLTQQSPEIANLVISGAEVIGALSLGVVLLHRMRGRERLHFPISRVGIGNGVAWRMHQQSFIVGGVVWRD